MAKEKEIKLEIIFDYLIKTESWNIYNNPSPNFLEASQITLLQNQLKEELKYLSNSKITIQVLDGNKSPEFGIVLYLGINPDKELIINIASDHKSYTVYKVHGSDKVFLERIKDIEIKMQM